MVGVSLDGDQLAQVRKIIATDPSVERVDHLLTVRLGAGRVSVTAAVRLLRRRSLDQVDQAIERLEPGIQALYPTIQQLYVESGAFKDLARQAALGDTLQAIGPPIPSKGGSQNPIAPRVRAPGAGLALAALRPAGLFERHREFSHRYSLLSLPCVCNPGAARSRCAA